jgi:glycosyltransferase involved in cell wall biosynthesis
MTRVLHVIDTPGPGGAETVFVELASGVQRIGWESHAAVPSIGWASERLKERGLEPILLPTRRTTFDTRYLRRFAGLVRHLKIDLVQTHLLGPALYGSLACALGRRPPVVATFHGFLDIVEGRVWPAKRWLLRHGPAMTVFVSAPLQDAFVARGIVNPHRTVVIPNGIAPAMTGPEARCIRASLGVQPDEILVGAVGNVRPPKAYSVLLRAAAQVRSRSSRVRFVVVGDTTSPDYPELLRLRAALGLEGVVAFTGFRSDIHDVLRALDIYAISSSEEGFSLSTLEAMAAGLPVVATRCGGPETIITSEKDGVLVQPNSPDQLAGAILQLAERPERRWGLGASAQVTASRFGLNRMLESYEQVYGACLGA